MMNPNQLRHAIESRLWLLIENANAAPDEIEKFVNEVGEDITGLCRAYPQALLAGPPQQERPGN